MSSSAASTPPPGAVSRSFSQQQAGVTSHLNVGNNSTNTPSKHSHSHSHSGLPPTSTAANNLGSVPASAGLPPRPVSGHHVFNASSGGLGSSSGNSKYRASVDAAGRMNQSGNGASLGLGRSPGVGQRPSSEMLPSGAGLGFDPETDAIDRWFEDLQHYEQTLEEMAAASLDQNFKEELGAIEQWFRVLSEAERTAALYSLLQSSTPVQIRFFITVLQQMARSDPSNAALFSPSNPQQASMEAQMEAKMASLGFKSPSSPAVRQFARQSLGPGSANDFGGNYLSPNSALNDSDANAAALLASQRAKLKAQAHRISAPGQLATYTSSANSAGLWAPEAIAEGSVRSSSPNSQRPKSTGSDYSMPAGNVANNMLRSPNMGTASFEELSPMVGGGSWASMTNTPVVPMFGASTNSNNGVDPPLSPRFDMNDVNNKFNNTTWGNNSATQRSTSGSNLVLDDAKKFRRSGRVSDSNTVGTLPQAGNGVMGALGGANRSVSAGQTGRTGTTNATSAQQQAALSAQQNWRNVNGLLTPNSAASFNTSTSSATGMSPADVTNALLLQQQQMQAQIQIQQNLLAMNGINMGMLSPSNNLMALGMNMPLGMNNMGNMSPNLNSPGGARRSPRMSDRGGQGNRTPSATTLAAGSGSNPDESIDINLLNDVPAWLRSLRLHKYTTNFEKDKWEDIVKMDEAALEAKGVAAQGARRKLLKVFENVRFHLWNEPRAPPTPEPKEAELPQ